MIVQSVVSNFTFDNNKSQIHFTLWFFAIFGGTSKMVSVIMWDSSQMAWPMSFQTSLWNITQMPHGFDGFTPQDFAVRLLCDRLQMDGVAIGPGAWMTPNGTRFVGAVWCNIPTKYYVYIYIYSCHVMSAWFMVMIHMVLFLCAYDIKRSNYLFIDEHNDVHLPRSWFPIRRGDQGMLTCLFLMVLSAFGQSKWLPFWSRGCPFDQAPRMHLTVLLCIYVCSSKEN